MPPYSQFRPILQLTTRRLAPPSLSTAAFSTSLRTMAQEYKLKGISSLDLKNGEKREVEVEGIENGKVLLLKHGSQTHAMSSNCTHYGAPMKNGVVTPDGRLTCAWHGGSSLISSEIPGLTHEQPVSTLLLATSRMPQHLIHWPNSRSLKRVGQSISKGKRAQSRLAEDNQMSNVPRRGQIRSS